MYTKNTIVKNRTGLHARPASDFVNAAKSFKCKINIWRTADESEKANAKSIVALLALGFEQNEEVTIGADGDNAQAAVDTLIELIDSGFGET